MQNQLVPQRSGGGLPQNFNTLVRNYVHYEQLTSNLQQQTTNARSVKNQFEDKIIEALQSTNMQKATIQISNGRLQLLEEKSPAPLNFNTLESLLHDYFRAKGSTYPDETANILKFIREHRKINTSVRLKRDLFVPPTAPSAT
jgi:hypothetical protein